MQEAVLSMNNLYWNVYRNLEREVLTLADVIHIDDKQVDTYSMKIADLLMRAASEVESISKELYHVNGGSESPVGKHLYFDSDCIKFLNQKWNLEKKKVFLTSPYFYFENKDFLEMTPLVGAGKKKANPWLNAYQAVKHDRAKCLVEGSIRNLLQAMAGLFVLNVYYRNEPFSLKTNSINDFDYSLGSQLFSIKVHPFPGIGLDDIYRKRDDFDECVYLVHILQDSKKNFFEMTKKINERQKELIESWMEKEIQEKQIDFESLCSEDRLAMVKKYEIEGAKLAHQENFRDYHIALDMLRFQCVLNKKQY